MFKIIYFIISIPVLFLTISFAVTNRQDVVLGVWPFPFELTMPLSLALFAVGAVFFIMGGFYFWIINMPLRAERYFQAKKIKELDKKLAEQNAVKLK
jgi:uncharacterized membrane protein YciS (DUF1049 family)